MYTPTAAEVMDMTRSGLLRPYVDGRLGTLERLRLAVLGAVLPPEEGADARARRILYWVLRGDLRSFFPGLPKPDPEAISTQPAAVWALLKDQLPARNALEIALPLVEVSGRVTSLLGLYFTSQLPQKQIEAYCTLLCLCALERKNV